jgi:hypothetical protein
MALTIPTPRPVLPVPENLVKLLAVGNPVDQTDLRRSARGAPRLRIRAVAKKATPQTKKMSLQAASAAEAGAAAIPRFFK